MGKQKSESKPLPSIYSIDDIKRVYDYTSQGHWFSKETMRFFGTRLTSHFRKISETEFLFITTECNRMSSSPVRKATVRRLTIKRTKKNFHGFIMEIESATPFHQYTIQQAKKVMGDL